MSPHRPARAAALRRSLASAGAAFTSSSAASRRALSSPAAAAAAAPLVHPPPLYFFQPESDQTTAISPWHDLPLRPSTNHSDPAVVTFVNEIPRGGRAKMEISTTLPGNPIVQDSTKKGDPRFYFLDSLVNYGAVPQTYEDPEHKDEWTGLLGDGDPVDVCEIGSAVAPTGGVYAVKVLGALAMLDGGETDWKLLAVRADDPLAARVSDVSNPNSTPDEVKRAADAIREWFRTYKIPEGKGENSFAFDGRWLGREEALKILDSTHRQWKATVDARTGAQAGKKSPWLPSLKWSASRVVQPAFKPSAILSVATSSASKPSGFN